MRSNPTDSEAELWEALRNRKLDGRKFKRQVPVGKFIVDFLCSRERLIVEVDGAIHDDQKAYDASRQEVLEDLGFRFVRVEAEEVIMDLDGVLDKIRAAFE